MELYAIKYGESVFRKKSIYKDMSSSKEYMEFVWLYYLAKHNGKVLLFDTGFRDNYDATKWGVKLIDVENEIKELINGPQDVDVVFITHSHFDHICNLDLYENTEIIIAKKEFENAIKEKPHPVKNRLNQGNVIKVDDEYFYDDKFYFKIIGGHSTGSSVIYFSDNTTSYVITGDECYLCDNMLSGRAIGSYVDIQKNLQFITDAKQKALVPLTFHDPIIFNAYEHISENIVRII